jgi:general secretion pathway protein K
MTPDFPKSWRYGYVSEDELTPRPRRRRVRDGHREGQPVPASDERGRNNSLRPHRPRRGVALVVVVTAITILAVFVADLIENTTTDFHVATAERDRLKAEYLAKSGLNLTRLLIAREPQIKGAVAMLLAPLYGGRQVPQLNVWDFADVLLAPFADRQSARAMSETSGIDFSMMEGIVDTGGTFEVIATPENSKINVNRPLFFAGLEGKKSIAMQMFALLGGYQSPASPYDPMFSARDPDGQYTTRLDLVSALIDWWDPDEMRSMFDPGSSTLTEGGSEDDVYRQYDDPYRVKNAPFDSIEELRMIRGVGDDFWATFVEADPSDPRSRKLTIYASGAVNVNQAEPEVLLSRLCSFVTAQALCMDPMEAAAFVSLLRTVKSFTMGLPLFASPDDFLNFVSIAPSAQGGPGGQGSSNQLMQMLMNILGPGNPLIKWPRLTLTEHERSTIRSMFITEAAIFTIQSTAHVGRARAKMSMVVNFDRVWTPPPGVPGTLPALGVGHHYRLE